MDEILKNMDAKKRDRIINSALEEFSKRGFDKASTNIIVKNAGISKGLLFHYFDNKKILHSYLENYVVRTVISNIREQIDWNETDFFNRMKHVALIKGGLTFRYPYIFNFFTTVLADKSIDDIYVYREDLAPGLMEKIYVYNIDYSKFKPTLDMERTMKIINWVFEKFSLEILDKLLKTSKTFEYKQIEEDFNKYVDILKEAFYK